MKPSSEINQVAVVGTGLIGSSWTRTAFFLSPRLPPFEYADGNLTVKLEVAMFSYPEKAMLGAFSVRLTQPDVSSQDTSSENDLVALAAERALEKFSRIAPTL